MFAKYKKFNRITLKAGDLRHRITLQQIAIDSPQANEVDFELNYTDIIEVWAAIRTVSNKSPFDEINIDGEVVTHRFFIRKTPEIDSDITKAILSDGNRYIVINVEDTINNDGQYIRLDCNFKGSSSKVASKW